MAQKQATGDSGGVAIAFTNNNIASNLKDLIGKNVHAIRQRIWLRGGGEGLQLVLRPQLPIFMSLTIENKKLSWIVDSF